MQEGLVWERDGLDWPHRDASRFVPAGGLRWHVQQFGAQHAKDAPLVLLLHGTGASTHSWRGLAPLLAARAHVLAMDLPGHGFTGLPPQGTFAPQLSLQGMTQGLVALLQALGASPALVVGHSAGAAIAVRMALDGFMAPRALVGINGALLPLGGLAGRFFSPVAKLMAAAPFVPYLFARRAADPVVLQRLLDGTGSRLDATGTALYGQLVRNPGHAAGALGMMAQWDLPGLLRDLPGLATPLHLMVGDNDRTIPPAQAREIAARLAPGARRPVVTLSGLGHLAHEEQPDLVVAQVARVMAEHGLL